MPKILVLDCYRHTLAVIRALEKAGHTIILGCTQEDLSYGNVHYSKACSQTWLHSDIVDSADKFCHELVEFLSQNTDIEAIFPVGEDSLRVILSIHSKLPESVTLISPEKMIVDECLDKPTSVRILESLGITVPKSETITSQQDLEAFKSHTGLPIILKPLDSRHLLLGEKCLRITCEEEYQILMQDKSALSSPALAQSLIEGKRHNCMFVAQDGQLLAYFESKVIRTTKPNDTGYSVLDQSIEPTAQHLSWCKSLVEHYHYTGIGCIQFLKDENTGKSAFLEVNPRTDATIAIATGCGINLPDFAVRACLGEKVTAQTDYRIGLKRHWLMGDITLTKALLLSAPGKLILQLPSLLFHWLFADIRTIWQPSDPGPTIAFYLDKIKRKLFRK
ncbi:ATP-grasp domain-containing protein [Aliikangiella sp. G2MR2-5]|uniref:ATP-grasp domain-containing protein n=1 Tax=Aliikangiella sp. G2MR2-5 TaxID=2788943 RepID=UPI0018AAC181|nr:ATP-grasp domain-containing protein [Aliikangiella sp. G2MR2-5]